MHNLGKIALLGAATFLSTHLLAATPACHRLMTEKECTVFTATLSTLPKGQARARWLEEHHALMRERETACRYSRPGGDVVIYYPHVNQVARGS